MFKAIIMSKLMLNMFWESYYDTVVRCWKPTVKSERWSHFSTRSEKVLELGHHPYLVYLKMTQVERDS
jgi:hypothetical protein